MIYKYLYISYKDILLQQYMVPLIVFGTRPEYLKIKPLITYFSSKKLEHKIIHILQHSDILIEEPHLRLPILSESSDIPRLSILGTTILSKLPQYLNDIQMVIVQGDTATAFYSALCAFQQKIPVVHIEAGLRTYDLENPFPEEAYRSMISRIATYHMCPSENAVENIKRENITQNVHLVGNTILDQTLAYNYTVTLGNTVLITIHRRENWESLDTILRAIEILVKQCPTLKFIWILHMNPFLKISVLNYFKDRMISNIVLIDPINHSELIKYISSCYCVITDSGGIQEEASFLGKHCFVLRKCTERCDIPSEYISIINNPESLLDIFLSTSISILPPCNVYGNGTSSQKIYNILSSI